jgi:multiple sugar transport system permease protein
MRTSLLARCLSALTYILLVIVLLLSLFPIYWLFSTSIKPREQTFAVPPVWVFQPTLENYANVLGNRQFVGYLRNSLIVALTTTAVAVGVGVLAAYALARFQFRGRQAFRFIFLLPQVTPAVAVLVPMFVMFNSLNLIGTYTGIVLSHLTLTLPFAIWMMTGFFEDSPVELEESAMIDGCTRLGALVRVVLPVLGPGIAATAALGFITSWNEFLFSSMLTDRDTRTLSVAITSFLTNRALDWGRTAAAGSLILIPVLVFAFFTQRYLVRGLSHGAVKG